MRADIARNRPTLDNMAVNVDCVSQEEISMTVDEVTFRTKQGGGVAVVGGGSVV